MPSQPLKPCAHPGCRELIRIGAYCLAHTKQRKQVTNDSRESSTQRGYGYAWQKASKSFLRSHPLCQCPDCQEGKLRLKASEVVDHFIPHRLSEALKSGDPEKIARAKALFWDHDNWRAMSIRCHNAKTAREDGGFGNRGVGQKSGSSRF